MRTVENTAPTRINPDKICVVVNHSITSVPVKLSAPVWDVLDTFSVTSLFSTATTPLTRPERNVRAVVNALKFGMRDEREVVSFLTRHAQVVAVLGEIRQKIDDYFGPHTRVELEVVREPDEPNDDELFAVIVTQLPVQEARARLRQLDFDWWLDAAARADFRMNLQVDFE